MAKAREFEKVALVVGILSANEQQREQLLSKLTERYGAIKSISPVMDFPYTDYYDNEMGGHPVRYLILFDKLVDPSQLADFKTASNEIEKEFIKDNGRTINIDPGVLSLSNFILATCKDRSHRIALKDGIYAEVTLIYQDKDYRTLPWTYSDYSSNEVKDILKEFRNTYKQMVKEGQ